MLEIAIYNQRQHVQLRCDASRLVLACAPTGTWDVLVGADIDLAPPALNIRAAQDGIHAQFRGSKEVLDEREQLAWSADRRFSLPAAFSLGGTWFEMDRVATMPKRPSRKLQRLHSNKGAQHAAVERCPAPATLVRWLAALGGMHRWSAASPEFYAEAARFVIDPLGLDGAFVLLRRGDAWQLVGSYVPTPELGIRYEPYILERLLELPETQYDGAETRTRRRVEVVRNADDLENHLQLFSSGDRAETPDHDPAVKRRQSVVISPLVDEASKLIGAVYGYRAQHAANGRQTIRPLEARLVDLLASSVSAGIARLERESALARQRALFEQSFSPAVAEVLQRNPTALAGQERDVTVLFADLRNFSSICAALGARDSYDLLSQVMESLTAAVTDHEGVVIDYYGDGLAAMWNAPLDQRNHAELACRAALDMLETLPGVSKQRHSRLERALRVGIGIHTGMATVGNVGSRQKLKYGPRGATVNLAARVEAATKKLRLPVLVTRATAEQLSTGLISNRVCRARLSGIAQAVDLYSISRPANDPSTLTAWDRYEKVLIHYEAGNLECAEELLASAPRHSDTVPFRFLAEEVQNRRNRQLGRRDTDSLATASETAILLELK